MRVVSQTGDDSIFACPVSGQFAVSRDQICTAVDKIGLVLVVDGLTPTHGHFYNL